MFVSLNCSIIIIFTSLFLQWVAYFVMTQNRRGTFYVKEADTVKDGVKIKNGYFKKAFWLVLTLNFISFLTALFGFIELATISSCEIKESSASLTVISILLSGVIAGNFAFKYEESSSREKYLTLTILIPITTVIYILFGCLVYLMGQENAENWLEISLAVSTCLLLLSLSCYRLWDYIEI